MALVFLAASLSLPKRPASQHLGPTSIAEIGGKRIRWALALESPPGCEQCWCNCAATYCWKKVHHEDPYPDVGQCEAEPPKSACLAAFCSHVGSDVDVVGASGTPTPDPPPPRQYAGTASSVTILAGSGQPGDADGTGAEAEFNEPKGLEVSADGAYLYVAEYVNHRIRRVEVATGTVTTVAGSGTADFADGAGANASFNQPAGLALFPDGKTLLVGDVKNSAIRSIELSTNTVSTLAGGGAPDYADGPLATAKFALIADVVVSPDAATVYVADGGNNRIRAIDLHARSVSTTVENIPRYLTSSGPQL